MAHNTHNNTPRFKTALGLGTAGLLGAYYLYSTRQGERKRKKIESWMLRAKADVLDETGKLKKVSKETYEGVVDTVLSKYQTMKGIDMAELLALGTVLKRHWDNMTADMSREISKPRTTRRAVKASRQAKQKKSNEGDANAL